MNTGSGIKNILLSYKTQNTVVLSGTSLCAIVRDEIVNAAFGVDDFVRSTVPFVESAVIVDTGSVDGTWEKLRELRKEYPNLRIYRKKFNSYSAMRNYSLTKIKTKYALILDADERLTMDDFVQLEKELQKNPKVNYFYLNFLNVKPTNECRGSGHNIRLFKIISGIYFEDGGHNVWEYLFDKDGQRLYSEDCHEISIKIKHFLSDPESYFLKDKNWYEKVVQNNLMSKIAPSEINGFMTWKKPNPRRAIFI